MGDQGPFIGGEGRALQSGQSWSGVESSGCAKYLASRDGFWSSGGAWLPVAAIPGAP